MGRALESRRLVEWVRAMSPSRMLPSKPWTGPAAPLARSSATASVAGEEGAKDEAELLDPRLAVAAV